VEGVTGRSRRAAPKNTGVFTPEPLSWRGMKALCSAALLLLSILPVWAGDDGAQPRSERWFQLIFNDVVYGVARERIFDAVLPTDNKTPCLMVEEQVRESIQRGDEDVLRTEILSRLMSTPRRGGRCTTQRRRTRTAAARSSMRSSRTARSRSDGKAAGRRARAR
jgi:hypothetical protein